MEITGVKLHVFEAENDGLVTSYKGLSRQDTAAGTIQYTFVRVLTDEDVEGHYVLWSEIPEARPGSLSETLELIEPFLVGEDPLDREKIWQRLANLWYGKKGPAMAAVDVALWDIAGKQAGEPIYKLLGAYRDRVPAYASGNPAPGQDVVNLATDLVDEGYTALKLHPLSVDQCRAVREAVGPGVDLMHDPVFAYDRAEALRVGRQLEELKFTWFEAPIPPTDVSGYVSLTSELDIPVTVELQGSYGEFVRRNAVDRLRTMNGFTGGITEMRKLADVAAFHGMRWEPHTYGGVFYQMANLHAILATKQATFFELPIKDGESGVYAVGTDDEITIDDEGYVTVPDRPGLGVGVDWDAVENGRTIEL